MRDFLIGVLLITCGCSWSSDLKKEVHSDDQTYWTEHHEKVKKVHQDPTEIEITEQAVVVETPTGVEVIRIPKSGKSIKLPVGAKVVGTVPVLDQHKDIGAKDIDTSDKGDKAKAEEKKSTENTEKERDVGVSKTVYFVAISAIVAVLIALFLYVRSFFPKKVQP